MVAAGFMRLMVRAEIAGGAGKPRHWLSGGRILDAIPLGKPRVAFNGFHSHPVLSWTVVE
jgi:hypothetical protein